MAKIIENTFDYGDRAIIHLRVTVLDQFEDEGVQVLVTEEYGEFRDDDEPVLVAYHDPED